MTKNLFGKLQAWRVLRRQRGLARWEQTRAKGKTRFVIRTTLIWGGTMIVGMSLTEYFRYRSFRLLVPIVIYFAIAAPIVSLVLWWSNEGAYVAARLDARMKVIEKVSSDGET